MSKHFRLLLVFSVILFFSVLLNFPGFANTEISLPKPIVTGQSIEICLNSRDSDKTLSGTATNQQISNILWAAGTVPMVGTDRKIYVTTKDGTYLHNAQSNSLTKVSNTSTDQGAFKISWESSLDFDAGLIYMPSLLAAVSLWQSTESPVANCPKGLEIIFGVENTTGLNTKCVAHSSVLEGQPGWLPDPSVNGDNKLEEVLDNLHYTDHFTQNNLTLQQVSQILWAGYGCTPHTGNQGRAGLTVPSANASYYYTGKIYMINEEGIQRYYNRNPGDTTYTTQDHRLEQINNDDVRKSLQVAINNLPEAPCYIVLCLEDSQWKSNYARLESGFIASNILMQTSAMGLGCYFTAELTSNEQQTIIDKTKIPVKQIPRIIISIGDISSNISTHPDDNTTNSTVPITSDISNNNTSITTTNTPSNVITSTSLKPPITSLATTQIIDTTLSMIESKKTNSFMWIIIGVGLFVCLITGLIIFQQSRKKR